jgi:hypothetical protein
MPQVWFLINRDGSVTSLGTDKTSAPENLALFAVQEGDIIMVERVCKMLFDEKLIGLNSVNEIHRMAKCLQC